MVAFEFRSRFGAFKDPLTVSQNITFPIPPKTAIGGVMAAILGIDDYQDDKEYFSFGYSLILRSEIRKKSFSQNYINDYTTKSLTQLNLLMKKDVDKLAGGFRDTKSPQKPINRELLINPKYLIFIDGFKYQKQLEKQLQNRQCHYPVYMGNSEFAATFEYVNVQSVEELTLTNDYLHSFIAEEDASSIDFESGVRYSNMRFATATTSQRQHQKYQNIVLASSPIRVKTLTCKKIVLDQETVYCQFL